MVVFCTYCSKGKTDDPGDVPAIERYTSQRIRTVYACALLAGQDFQILSGEYGLIGPSYPTPNYDHLLAAYEVDRLAVTVARQLNETGATGVVYFTNNVDHEPKLQTYLDTMRRACKARGLCLVVVELPEQRRKCLNGA